MEIFEKKLKECLIKKVDERYSEGEVIVKDVQKNNDVCLRAICIVRQNQEAIPTIYIDGFFDDYIAGRSIENICDEILEIYEKGIDSFSVKFTADMIRDFETIKDRLAYRLVNYNMNRNVLKGMPHYKFLDMAIVYYLIVNDDYDNPATVSVTDYLMEEWGVNIDVIADIASKNTQNRFPAVITKMEDIIAEIVKDEMIKGERKIPGEYNLVCENFNYCEHGPDLDDIVQEEVIRMKGDENVDMYVMSNEKKYFGAACIAYPGVLKKFADEHKCDFFVIPSSVHEVILVPKKRGASRNYLNGMLREVNRRELDNVDILSNHVYIYDSRENDLIY